MNILLASMHKSGSKHIRLTLLRMLDGFIKANLTVNVGGNYSDEHRLVDEELAELLKAGRNRVFLHHIKASPTNLRILKKYPVRPIVIMRNALDCLVSLRDAYNSIDESGAGLVPSEGNWGTWDEEQKFKWLVYNALPWYYSFYLSWKIADISCLNVWYEEHFKDQISSFRRILEHVFEGNMSDHHRALMELDGKIEKYSVGKGGGFVTGISGRGKKEIPSYLIDVAYDMAASWGPEWESQLKFDLLDRVQ